MAIVLMVVRTKFGARIYQINSKGSCWFFFFLPCVSLPQFFPFFHPFSRCPPLLLSFLLSLFLPFYPFERQGVRERGHSRERDIFDLLSHSSDDCNSQDLGAQSGLPRGDRSPSAWTIVDWSSCYI